MNVRQKGVADWSLKNIAVYIVLGTSFAAGLIFVHEHFEQTLTLRGQSEHGSKSNSHTDKTKLFTNVEESDKTGAKISPRNNMTFVSEEPKGASIEQKQQQSTIPANVSPFMDIKTWNSRYLRHDH